MPTVEHDSLVELFRKRPLLAAEVLRDVLGLELPPFDEAGSESSEHNQPKVTEYHSDRVVVLKASGKPVLGIVVEVQRQRDDEKLLTWPVYATALRRQLGCETGLLVIATTRTVARWASRPIPLGCGNEFRPAVLELRGGVPVIADLEAARTDPELAVLSAVSHGRHPDPAVAVQVALTALTAVATLDDDRKALYSDMILAALSAAARKAFEMIPQGYQFQSKAGREGQARGRAEGKAEGKAEAILQVLEARGLAVSDAQRARIAACADLEVLRQWVRRAVTAASADELLDGE